MREGLAARGRADPANSESAGSGAAGQRAEGAWLEFWLTPSTLTGFWSVL